MVLKSWRLGCWSCYFTPLTDGVILHSVCSLTELVKIIIIIELEFRTAHMPWCVSVGEQPEPGP